MQSHKKRDINALSIIKWKEKNLSPKVKDTLSHILQSAGYDGETGLPLQPALVANLNQRQQHVQNRHHCRHQERHQLPLQLSQRANL